MADLVLSVKNSVVVNDSSQVLHLKLLRFIESDRPLTNTFDTLLSFGRCESRVVLYSAALITHFFS